MHVARALEQLKALLPGDTPAKLSGEYCYETVDHFLDHDEPELALNAIVYIADAHHENAARLNPSFWPNARKLAVHLGEMNESTTYSDTIADTLQSIDEHLKAEGDVPRST